MGDEEREEAQTARQEAAAQRRSVALAKVGVGERGVMLRAMDDLKEFAETAVNSGTAPRGMNVGQAMMAIQAGLERGLGPLGGLQSCVVINGQLSWRGWAAKALIQQSGLVEPGTFRTWHEGDLDGPKANAVGYATATRKGYAKPFVRKFSVADAKKAGLWNKPGPWQTRPGNMLEWRALGDLARFEFSEVLGGVPIADDVEGGYGSPEVTVEEPQERAHRPAPQITDPLLGQIGNGDKSGVPIETEGEVVPEEPSSPTGQENEGEHGEESLTPPPAQADPTPEPPQEEGVSEPKRGNATACPRCGEEDSGYALLGECGVCNYPGPEPGAAA